MKKLLLVALLAVFVGTAGADVPDPDESTCEPWDTWGNAFVTPGHPTEINPDTGNPFSAVDCITVTVKNNVGDLLPNIPVQIILSDCDRCPCDPEFLDRDITGAPAVTDASGTVIICPSVGGCDECTVTVTASDVTICSYFSSTNNPALRSTDWEDPPGVCDWLVGALDITYFAGCFVAIGAPSDECVCADYDSDATVGAIDLTLFAGSFAAGDKCLVQGF
jgi:hypothetical protein